METSKTEIVNVVSKSPISALQISVTKYKAREAAQILP